MELEFELKLEKKIISVNVKDHVLIKFKIMKDTDNQIKFVPGYEIYIDGKFVNHDYLSIQDLLSIDYELNEFIDNKIGEIDDELTSLFTETFKDPYQNEYYGFKENIGHIRIRDDDINNLTKQDKKL